MVFKKYIWYLFFALIFIIGTSVYIFSNKNNSIEESFIKYSPIYVKLSQEKWVPQSIHPGNSPDKFIVFAYLKSEDKTINHSDKRLFMINSLGVVLLEMPLENGCLSAISVDYVGIVIDYCIKQSSSVYQVKNNSIEYVKEISPFAIDHVDVSKKIKDVIRGRSDVLNNNIKYQYKCTKTCFPDGGCCGPEMKFSIDRNESNIKGYSLRDFVKLDETKVAIIIGTGDPSRSSGNNVLMILDSNK